MERWNKIENSFQIDILEFENDFEYSDRLMKFIPCKNLQMIVKYRTSLHCRNCDIVRAKLMLGDLTQKHFEVCNEIDLWPSFGVVFYGVDNSYADELGDFLKQYEMDCFVLTEEAVKITNDVFFERVKLCPSFNDGEWCRGD